VVTIAEVIKQRGRTSGFDYLRLCLAMGVVIWHSVDMSLGPQNEHFVRASRILWPLALTPVPGFFALSGFLVAASLERNSIPAYLVLRAMRVLPALAAVVLVTALVIGPIVTTDPLAAYFTNRHFFSYFLNMIGYAHYTLPGVFENLPYAGMVNGQLWTIAWELRCYIALAVFAVFGIFSRPRLFAAIVVSAIVATTIYALADTNLPTITEIDPIYEAPVLVLSFFVGATLYLLRSVIPFSRAIFAVSIVLWWATLQSSYAVYLSPLPIAYMAMFIGLQGFSRLGFVRGVDYSYGIYLWGFPIQQLVSLMFPSFRTPLFNFLLGMPIIWGFAWMSWRLVESPVLSRKKIAVAMTDRTIATFKTY
jgi:peptidoglycan/LPS O-acetylase OafA/YrhL